MTTKKYVEIRDEIEDLFLEDMLDSVPYDEDVYSEDIVHDVFVELFSEEKLSVEDRLARSDAIRGVLAYYQNYIEDLYNELVANAENYEEAQDEEEMADWVDSSRMLPTWPIVRRAVHKYWKNFREEAETK